MGGIKMSEKNDGLMWALVKEKPEEGLWMKRVPIPEVGPNDVKIKIHKTAICGTDVHIWQWNDWRSIRFLLDLPLAMNMWERSLKWERA